MTMTQNDLFLPGQLSKMQHKVSVKFGHGHFGQIRFLMKKSSKDSIYK